MKSRLSSLKQLRHQIREEDSLDDVSRWIMVCVIIHNMLVEEPKDELFREGLIIDEEGETEEDCPLEYFVDSTLGIRTRESLLPYILNYLNKKK